MCIKEDILSALAYFDLFRYPLNKREIFLFLPNVYPAEDLDEALDALVKECFIFQMAELYSLQNDRALIHNRNTSCNRALPMLQKARAAAKIIAAFPFVSAVAISGSLSKKVADEHADIDFFVITDANRLWMARTILHVFKKLTYLVNKQHHYCMNYFIDGQQLEILEKNVYTATELVTLIPVCGEKTFDRFFRANTWTRQWLPNHLLRVSATGEIDRSFVRSIVEGIFPARLGDWLDNALMRWTQKSWNAKTQRRQRNSKGFVMCLHSGKHFAKPDPGNFQRRILERHEAALHAAIARTATPANAMGGTP